MTGRFAERLKQCRERRGISRSTLSELIGFSKNTIGRYERGERAPSLRALVELADFFEVSLDWLAGRF